MAKQWLLGNKKSCAGINGRTMGVSQLGMTNFLFHNEDFGWPGLESSRSTYRNFVDSFLIHMIVLAVHANGMGRSIVLPPKNLPWIWYSI